LGEGQKPKCASSETRSRGGLGWQAQAPVTSEVFHRRDFYKITPRSAANESRGN
jgi:hypothetical protein